MHQKNSMKQLQHLFERTPRHVKLAALGGTIVVVIFSPQIVGLIVLAVYAAAAFVWKLPSRITFWAAVTALCLMQAAVALQQNVVAQNLGAYSFLLFVIAVICLCTELIREAKDIARR